MFCKLKTVVSFLRVIVTLLSLRPFGNIIHDIAGKYGKKVSISDLRKFEKTSIKVSKAELDLNFLKNCLSFNVLTCNFATYLDINSNVQPLKSSFATEDLFIPTDLSDQ